jgi:hypothetical protein
MRVLSVILILLLALAVSPAFAQDDNSISTSNSSQTSRIGVSVEPLWLFVKGIGGKVDYALTETVSVGVGGMYIPSHANEESSDKQTTSPTYKWAHNELNVGTNIMLTGTLATNGVYVNPAVGYLNTRITEYGVDKLQGELSTPQFRTTLGYQWINQRIRIAAGGGFKVIGKDEIIVKDSSGAEIFRDRPSQTSGLALDFQVGVMF